MIPASFDPQAALKMKNGCAFASARATCFRLRPLCCRG